jgi:hypothetical protein
VAKHNETLEQQRARVLGQLKDEVEKTATRNADRVREANERAMMAQNDVNATPIVLPPKPPTAEEEMAMMAGEDTKAHSELDDFGIFIDRFHRNGDKLNADFTYMPGTLLIDAFHIQMLKKYKSDCFMVLDYKNSYQKGRVSKVVSDITPTMPLVKYTYTNDVDSSSRLAIPDDEVIWAIGNAMKHCIANKTPIIMIPFSIHHHRNTLIYRTKDNTLERFEPHGEGTHATMATNLKSLSYDQRNAKIDELIKEIFITRMNILAKRAKTTLLPSNLVYLNAKHINPGQGFQSVEGNQSDRLRRTLGYSTADWDARFPGFCMIWALYYMELVLANPTMSGTDLTAKAMKYLKEKGDYGLFTQMLGYTKHIEQELRQAIKEDINITSASASGASGSKKMTLPPDVRASAEFKAIKTKTAKKAFIDKYLKDHPEWNAQLLNKKAIKQRVEAFIEADLKSIHAEFIGRMPNAPFPALKVSVKAQEKKAGVAIEKGRNALVKTLEKNIKTENAKVVKLRAKYDKLYEKDDSSKETDEAWSVLEQSMLASASSTCEITRVNAGFHDREFGGSKPKPQPWSDKVSYKIGDEVLYANDAGEMEVWSCSNSKMYINGFDVDIGDYLDFKAKKVPGHNGHLHYWELQSPEDE